MGTELKLAPAACLLALLCACTSAASDTAPSVQEEPSTGTGTPEYFLLRPEVEKAYGYTHAVKIGDDIKISGAVSMDDEGPRNLLSFVAAIAFFAVGVASILRSS